MNTDKYEGHTRGPWSDKTALYWVTEEDDGSYQVDIDHKPDKLLIHDAPLLLAEVKKLQAWKLWVCALVQQHDGPHLREMLKELIE